MSFLTPQQAADLAVEHHRAGRFAEAEGIYLQLLASEPENPDLLHLLGLVSHHTGRHAEALELIHRAIAINPNMAPYHNNLGTLLIELRDYERAMAAYHVALRLEPNSAGPWYNIGIIHTRRREWPLAVEAYRTALQFDPDYPSCVLNLATALAASGRLDEGIALYEAALERRPNDVAIATNLGNLLKERGDTDGAIARYHHALGFDPNNPSTLNNLAVAFQDQGRHAESAAAYRRSLEIKPGNAEVHSNLILAMLYDPRGEPAPIVEEQRRWNRQHLDPLKTAWRPHSNSRDPKRRLKIGYVSADLRDHVVGRAVLPVIERHDRDQFEIVCYSNGERDAVTKRFAAHVDQWSDTSNLRDEVVAEKIRADEVDILVDLALHTSDNRLLTFARKPAPVQVSWLGYPGTSGLEAIDYRLTDPFLEPPGMELAASGEQPFRLPDIWSCYEAPSGFPPVAESPALRAGYVTFGSLNSFFKINARTLDTWIEILRAVDQSRLRLLTKTGSHRKWVTEFMCERGIDASRIIFFDYESAAQVRPQAEYLRRYDLIDVALDTFPYNGMTTTCDALWMGVPVVSLVGKLSLGRAGLSLLSNVGLPEFAVDSPAEYVRTAVELARDLPRLTALRRTLRSRMQASPILDASRLARNVEAAYRTMWETWCQQAGEVR